MNHLTWNIQVKRQQACFVKPCPRCHNSIFESSNKFRINAQQHYLDVWLILKCNHCKSTYNLPIYERISPAVLKAMGIYNKLLANDARLAADIACNVALLKRNGIQPAKEVGQMVIAGGVPLQAGQYAITVYLPQGLRLRTDNILAQKLAVARTQIQKAIKIGFITWQGGKKPPAYWRSGQILYVQWPFE